MDSAYHHGLSLFNAGHFYDAHEVLEDVWRASAGPDKRFLQGLVQAAVALHHHSTGNLEGARSVLRRACRNLSSYPDGFGDIDLGALRRTLDAWLVALEGGAPLPAVPRIIAAAPQC